MKTLFDQKNQKVNTYIQKPFGSFLSKWAKEDLWLHNTK